MGKVSVRYIVSDVDAAIPFYERLGFQVDMHPAPPFARLMLGDLYLLLSQPGAGGAGQLSTAGDTPQPGGWNRFQVEMSDIEAFVARLKDDGYSVRTEVVQGNGGRQAVIEDPSGNPVELFEPPANIR